MTFKVFLRVATDESVFYPEQPDSQLPATFWTAQPVHDETREPTLTTSAIAQQAPVELNG